MPDQNSPAAEQAERIAKLEEQTQQLQKQVKELLKRQKTTNRNGRDAGPTRLRDALSSDVMTKTFVVLLLTSLLPIFLPPLIFASLPSSMMSSMPFPPWDVFNFFPGGKAVWMPMWQTSMLLTFLVGAVTFIASK